VYKLFDFVKEEWDKLPKDFLQKLVNSVPRRIRAVIRNHGGSTSYWQKRYFSHFERERGGLSLHLFYLFIYLTRTAVPQPGEIVEPDCADRDSVPWTLEQKTCEPLAPSPRLLRGQSLSSDAVFLKIAFFWNFHKGPIHKGRWARDRGWLVFFTRNV